MKIQNLERLITKLKFREKEAGQSPSVIVGYSQSYSIFVHENLAAHHPVGQAKFLEYPARKYRREITDIVVTAIRRGATLAQALLLGGLRLQREAQLLTPVDTGALKASAFTRLEKVR